MGDREPHGLDRPAGTGWMLPQPTRMYGPALNTGVSFHGAGGVFTDVASEGSRQGKNQLDPRAEQIEIRCQATDRIWEVKGAVGVLIAEVRKPRRPRISGGAARDLADSRSARGQGVGCLQGDGATSRQGTFT